MSITLVKMTHSNIFIKTLRIQFTHPYLQSIKKEKEF